MQLNPGGQFAVLLERCADAGRLGFADAEHSYIPVHRATGRSSFSTPVLAENAHTDPVTLPSAPPPMPPFPPVFAPDSSSLLRTLSAALDANDLRWIAEADRGRDAEENERHLQRIVSSGKVPPLLQWNPREVLELTRWDEPSPDDGEAVLWRRHLLRAFACAALLCSYGDGADYSYEGGRDATVLHLLDSLAVLSPTLADLDRDAIALLAWVIPRLATREPEDHPFFGFAALWFGLGASLPDPALLSLAEWLMEVEDAVGGQWRRSLGVGATGPWLLTLVEPRGRRDKWRRVGLSLPGRIPGRCGMAVREVVGLFAAMMDESAEAGSPNPRDPPSLHRSRSLLKVGRRDLDTPAI